MEELSAPASRYNHLMVLPLTLKTRAERGKLAMPAIRTTYGYIYLKNPPKHSRTSNQQRVTRHDLFTHSRSPLGLSDFSQGREGLMEPRVRLPAFKIIQELHSDRPSMITP